MRTLAVGVPPFNTTLMGMMRGVADSFGMALSNPMLFGGSGHAFIIHIHETLCPSGPYCWDRKPFMKLTRNLGIQMTDLGFFGGPDVSIDRKRVEALLISEIDAGRPAGLVNMEFQLITGYDDTGFLITQPWPGMDFPPRHLTFESWCELRNEVHVNFFSFAQCDSLPAIDIVRKSLEFAVDLYEEPVRYSGNRYGMGPDAYRLWKLALPEHGSSHGNWWNATVWAECRRQASEYFTEIGQLTENRLTEELARDYVSIGDLLNKVSERDRPNESKLELLTIAEKAELDAVEKIRILLAAL